MAAIYKRWPFISLLPVAGFLLLYLLFPTSNSSVDAYYYAASVRHNGELFLPHHLLYNAVAWVVVQSVKLTGASPDILHLMQMMNAFAAAICLLLLRLLLRETGIPPPQVTGSLLIAGGSFAVMRYATENETYILPILFSLAASCFFVRFLVGGRSRNVFLSGCTAALAVLFHQIHVIWWMGLWFSIIVIKRQWKPALIYLSPMLMVPLAYAIVWWFGTPSEGQAASLIRFFFHEYYTGGASVSVDSTSILLAFINLFRTFFQVHGNMLLLLRQHVWLFLVVTVSLAFLVASFFQGKMSKKNDDTVALQVSSWHGMIFLFQFLFALLAGGNAEFMVMLPFLMVVFITGRRHIPAVSLSLAGSAMLLWNFFLGILPAHLYLFSDYSGLMALVRNNPEAIFILKEDQQLVAEHYYRYGEEYLPNIRKAPSTLKLKGLPADSLQHEVDQAIVAGTPVYTDSPGRPRIINRRHFLDNKEDEHFFSRYQLEKVDSTHIWSGMYYLYLIGEK